MTTALVVLLNLALAAVFVFAGPAMIFSVLSFTFTAGLLAASMAFLSSSTER